LGHDLINVRLEAFSFLFDVVRCIGLIFAHEYGWIPTVILYFEGVFKSISIRGANLEYQFNVFIIVLHNCDMVPWPFEGFIVCWIDVMLIVAKVAHWDANYASRYECIGNDRYGDPSHEPFWFVNYADDQGK